MASCNPGDERQHNSENNEHDNSASDVEIFIAQKNGEGAGIKEQARDQNELSVRKSASSLQRFASLFIGCNGTRPWIQIGALSFDFCF